MFKPHIVEFNNGKFAIRAKHDFFHWKYYDNQKPIKDDSWWYDEKFSYRFLFDTKEEAEKVLNELLNKNKPLKVVKVYK